MRRRLGLGLVLLTTMALLVGVVGVASVSASKHKGSEGCTPGYWKQSQHFGSWTSPYDPSDPFFSNGFENAFPGLTLLQVLQQGGGGLNALGRHTVAALLNTASDDVDTFYTDPQTVINLFNGVYVGTNDAYEALKDTFAGFNELRCPLGRAEL